jgi:hypothetical protein
MRFRQTRCGLARPKFFFEACKILSNHVLGRAIHSSEQGAHRNLENLFVRECNEKSRCGLAKFVAGNLPLVSVSEQPRNLPLA